MRMRSVTQTHPLMDNALCKVGENVLESLDDFFLTSGGRHPSLMELPFAIQEIQWERMQQEKMYVHGKSNGLQQVSFEIDLWRLELPKDGKPKVVVHQVSGPWLELLKPRDFYLETMRVVLVAAYFLAFVKQSPNSSKGAVWRYVRKECSHLKAKANEKDLAQAFLLLQAIVRSDPALEDSPILQKFFPTLSKKLGSQLSKDKRRAFGKVKVRPKSSTLKFHNSNMEGRWEGLTLRDSIIVCLCQKTHANGENLSTAIVKREITSPVREPVMEAICTSKRKTPIFDAPWTVSDIVKEEFSSQSHMKMRSLNSFPVEADLPLSKRLTPVTLKKKRPGRPARRRRGKRNAASGRKSEAKDDWIDEPDVCAFCDDGVDNGEKLLCCDGRCMRSFHPTIGSGWANRCPTLQLTRAAVSVESYVCPNCEFDQHQCFACGKLGSSTNSLDLQEVFVCGAKECRRFYHPDCVSKLLIPEGAQSNLACSIQLGEETFICPLHTCATCNSAGDDSVPEMVLVKCRRCPVAWHRKCLPVECEKQLWPVDGGQFVMYCGKHTLDPELLTPKRDHIVFPNDIKAGPLSSSISSLADDGHWPSCDIPVPENFGTGPHDTRAFARVCEIITESRQAVTREMVMQMVKPAPQGESQVIVAGPHMHDSTLADCAD